MKKTAIPFLIAGWLLFVFSPLPAQKIADFLSSYTGQNGQKYMQPLGDIFGANLNSGWYHNARISAMGLHIYLGAELMVAQVSDKQKTFIAKSESPFYPETEAEVSTILGNSKSFSVSNGEAGTTFTFPGGMDIKMLPLVVPQVTVGSLMGTQATVRWMDFKIGKDLGKLGLMGIGIQHSVSQYLPLFPLDLSVGLFMQNFKVGDVVKATTNFIGVQGSYQAGLLTLYGGVGYENAKIKISYTSGDNDIAFNFDAQNKIRMNLGLALSLTALKLHADYNIGTQSVLAIGAGLGF